MAVAYGVQLRNPMQRNSDTEYVDHSLYNSPASEDLLNFLKQARASKPLKRYLIDLLALTEVRHLLECREGIEVRAKERRQKFSVSELRSVLDKARQWEGNKRRCGSDSSTRDSGISTDARQEKERWRRSLKASNASSQLVRFLSRRSVKSRQDLLNRGDELISNYETKARRFSLLELKQLISDFQKPPLPAVIQYDQTETAQADWRQRQQRQQPPGGSRQSSQTEASETASRQSERPSQPQLEPESSCRMRQKQESTGNLLQRATDDQEDGERSEDRDASSRSRRFRRAESSDEMRTYQPAVQSGGLVNVVGHENKLEINLASDWPDVVKS